VPRNLEQKVAILQEDIRTLNTLEARRKIINFVLEEIAFSEAQHSVTEWDLTAMQSNAVNEFNQANASALNIDPSSLRVWCLLQAFVGFLNREGLIKFTLELKKKEMRNV